jgi:hypothetical protein
MIHPTTHLLMLKSCYESPRLRCIKGLIAGRAVPQEVFHGQRTAQGKKAQGRAVAENIDVGTQIAGLRDARLLESGDVDYARGQAGQQHWMCYEM